MTGHSGLDTGAGLVFPLRHHISTCSGTHQASHWIDTERRPQSDKLKHLVDMAQGLTE
jgi:hypothetical protein